MEGGWKVQIEGDSCRSPFIITAHTRTVSQRGNATYSLLMVMLKLAIFAA